jgi:hypothetical protein
LVARVVNVRALDQTQANHACSTGVGLFVPKPSHRTDCQRCGISDLGSAVRRRPLASTAVGGDCYSVGYSLLGSRPDGPLLVRHCHFVGYRRSPGDLFSLVTRSIGERRRSLWSTLVVSSPPSESRDRLLRRSFQAGDRAAAFLIRAGLLVVWLQLNVSGFRPVLARTWHGRPSWGSIPPWRAIWMQIRRQ